MAQPLLFPMATRDCARCKHNRSPTTSAALPSLRGQFGAINSPAQGELAMKNLVVRFVREENGQDLIEYSLLAAIIAVGCIVIMGTVSTSMQGIFQKIIDVDDNA